jgi:hypothetical protein
MQKRRCFATALAASRRCAEGAALPHSESCVRSGGGLVDGLVTKDGWAGPAARRRSGLIWLRSDRVWDRPVLIVQQIRSASYQMSYFRFCWGTG